MTQPVAARAFLESEIEALEPFDFVAAGPAGNPLHVVEVTRREDLGLEVRVPGRPPLVPQLPPPLKARLEERGFRSEDPDDGKLCWVREVPDPAAGAETALSLLTEVFEEKPEFRLDVAHGNHRAAFEAERKLSRVRERLEKALAGMLGRIPQKDADGDYLLPVRDVHVWVAPRVNPGGPVVVRVFAITNVGVTVGPELGLFLARLNFGLMFGRFALDAEHSSIWFDEALLGEHLDEEEFRFTVEIVANTADEWDDRLKQMFGGATYQEVLAQRGGEHPKPTKPGQGGAGGYL